jgi:hypothetical protein
VVIILVNADHLRDRYGGAAVQINLDLAKKTVLRDTPDAFYSAETGVPAL